ncbi:MAG: hypothetical protein J2P17_35095, partial [Mycobacterium sp.]|nr:hypothetical protein [Mycobacterium sp.]
MEFTPDLLFVVGCFGDLGVDGLAGDRLAAVVAHDIDLKFMAALVSADDWGRLHGPFVAPLV